jgi:DNA-binding MarR family transcriptional regulator
MVFKKQEILNQMANIFYGYWFAFESTLRSTSSVLSTEEWLTLWLIHMYQCDEVVFLREVTLQSYSHVYNHVLSLAEKGMLSIDHITTPTTHTSLRFHLSEGGQARAGELDQLIHEHANVLLHRLTPKQITLFMNIQSIYMAYLRGQGVALPDHPDERLLVHLQFIVLKYASVWAMNQKSPIPVSFPQSYILHLLVQDEQKHELTISYFMNHIKRSRSETSRLLSKLKQIGVVEFLTSPHDSRQQYVRLTPYYFDGIRQRVSHHGNWITDEMEKPKLMDLLGMLRVIGTLSKHYLMDINPQWRTANENQ